MTTPEKKVDPPPLEELIDILIRYMGRPYETAEQTLNHLKELREKLK